MIARRTAAAIGSSGAVARQCQPPLNPGTGLAIQFGADRQDG